MTRSVPVVLGGSPAFPERIPIVRPLLPPIEQIRPRIDAILSSGQLTKGDNLRELEERAAEHLGVRHVVGVSSCTLGLVLVCDAMGLRGGEVIVPSFTFMATVHPLRWIGADPVFVEVDGSTWNIDPSAVEAAITDRTVGIVGVHQFGNPVAVEELEALASKYGVGLIFDAAHGVGALRHGRPVGSFGSAEVFSLSPTKLLPAGEGGLVATDSDDIAEHVRLGREYGNPGDYRSRFPGLNARLPELSAAMALLGLPLVDQHAENRNRTVRRLRSQLADVPGIAFQSVADADRSSYKDLCLTVQDGFGLERDQVTDALAAEGIDTRTYHDPPVHRHPAYADLEAGHLPVTDDVCANIFSLPIWSDMPDDVIDGIGTTIRSLHTHADAVRGAIGSTGKARATRDGEGR